MTIQQKPKRKKFRQETVIHSYIHRPLSIEIIRLIWNTSVTANQITIFRIFFNILALLFFIQGTSSGFIVGFILFQINEVLDHVDGMYSRLKKQTSKIGAFLEYVFDELFAGSQGLFGFSIAYGAYSATNNLIYIWIFISMAIGYGLSKIFLIQFEKSKIFSKDLIHNIDHDKEDFMQILGVPFKKGIKNLSMTIVIWKNELLAWGALFYFFGLSYNIDLIFIALLIHSAIYQISWIKKIFIAYAKAKELDGLKR
jgi:phosphatidylglycerophosphate synthase